jgi:hypothetical protein
MPRPGATQTSHKTYREISGRFWLGFRNIIYESYGLHELLNNKQFLRFLSLLGPNVPDEGILQKEL